MEVDVGEVKSRLIEMVPERDMSPGIKVWLENFIATKCLEFYYTQGKSGIDIKSKDFSSNIIDVIHYLKSGRLLTKKEKKQHTDSVTSQETSNLENLHISALGDFPGLVARAKKYNASVANMLRQKIGDEHTEGEVLVKNLSDGYSLVELTERGNLEYETSHMNHCLGGEQVEYYLESIKTKCSRIYSIRDKFNKPHITIEIALENSSISEMVQKNNEDPDEKYKKYIAEAFNSDGLNIPRDQLLGFGIFYIGNHVFTNSETYEQELKKIYFSGDCSVFEGKDLYVPPGSTWFTKIPNGNYRSVFAEGSGLAEVSHGVKISNKLFLGNCSNLTKIEGIGSLEELDCEGSSVSEIGIDVSVKKRLILSRCRNLKILENIGSCETVYLTASGIESIGSGVGHIGTLSIAGCEHFRVLRNISCRKLMAEASGIERIGENVNIDQEASFAKCSRLKVLENIGNLKKLVINASGIEKLGEGFSVSDVFYGSHLKKLKTLENFGECKLVNFRNSSISEFGNGFSISGDANFYECRNLSEVKNIGTCQTLFLNGSSVEKIGENVRVMKELNIDKCWNIKVLENIGTCARVKARESGLESIGKDVNIPQDARFDGSKNLKRIENIGAPYFLRVSYDNKNPVLLAPELRESRIEGVFKIDDEVTKNKLRIKKKTKL